MDLSFARDLILGTTLAASALGLAKPALAESISIDPSPLNVATQVDRVSGELSSYLPPAYDGPIRWSHVRDKEQYDKIRPLVALTTGIEFGGIFGFAIYAAAGEDLKKGLVTGLAAGAIIGSAFYNVGEYVDKNITIPTTVTDVVEQSQPYTTHGRIGNIPVVGGPFYNQTIRIPETDLLLKVHAVKEPLKAGQSIEATFGIKDEQIQSWHLKNESEAP